MSLSRTRHGMIRFDTVQVGEWYKTVRANAHMRACSKALPRFEWTPVARRGYTLIILKFGGKVYTTGVDTPCDPLALSGIIRGLTIEALNDVIRANQKRLDGSRR